MAAKNFSLKLEKALNNFEVIHMDLKEYLANNDINKGNSYMPGIMDLCKKLEELYIYTHSIQRFLNGRKK